MRILLDECVTQKIKYRISEYEVHSVTEMSWNGIKNGDLMKLAIENGFDILLTIDKNLEFQQNLKSYNIAIVVFDVEKSKFEYLNELLPKFKEQIDSFSKGKAYRITKYSI
ncbi:MAG: DUF5615 family PIN-like protein [Cytophagales bacterium]